MVEESGHPLPLSSEIRRRMQRQGRRDTKPELAVRRAVWARGLRYRVDVPVLPGDRRRADLVFPRARVAVYVDGCFWHCCPEHGTLPKNNQEWWRAKLDANVTRDRDTDDRLAANGWTVVRVWEHESPEAAADSIVAAVRRAPPSSDDRRRKR